MFQYLYNSTASTYLVSRIGRLNPGEDYQAFVAPEHKQDLEPRGPAEALGRQVPDQDTKSSVTIALLVDHITSFLFMLQICPLQPEATVPAETPAADTETQNATRIAGSGCRAYGYGPLS